MKKRKVKKRRRVSWKTQCKRAALRLPKMKRQEFLDYMWQGMTLGEAKEKAGISFEEANGVMLLNMRKTTVLNRESV